MRKLAFLILLFLLLLQCAGQQNNTWYFGVHAGISFNPDIHKPLPYALHSSAMIASEGCSSVCDIDGNILFYCNGQTIYNRNNAVMQNGDNLMGHQSAFETALVVPLPNSPNLYYVFTADAYENNFANGYRYSIVDMNPDNGNGAVISKNILLNAPSSERLAAARHADGIDVWIITNDHSSNIFRAWLLTCNGLQPNPVVSTAGIILDQYDQMNTGDIKISPDGKLLCQTHFPDLSGQSTENAFQLFDFDNATGVISNPKTISIPLSRYFACEFSPDSKLLYLSKADTAEVDQFECTLNTQAQITASQFTITTPESLCGLQLGPDGKIYLTNYVLYLSDISRPNIKGSDCGFESKKTDLEGQTGGLNLPSFVNDMSVDVYNYFTAQILDTCAGKVQFAGHTNLAGVVQWSWNFGDGTVSTLQNPIHSFPSIDQLYTVKLKITPASQCGYIEKAKAILPGGLWANVDFKVINVCDSGYARFENKSTFYPDTQGQFIWDYGDGSFFSGIDTVHIYASQGIYNVTLKINTNATCLNHSLTIPLDFRVLNIQATPDQVINESQTVQLNVNGGGTVFQWRPSTGLSDPNIPDPVAKPLDDILYIVTATDDAGCRDVDSVFIKVNPGTDIFIPSAFTPNNDGKNDMLKPTLSIQYTLNYFTIYNRWGQVIFTTEERNKGWDGKLNGLLQNNDVYIWMIKVTDKLNRTILKKGTVMLLR